jgi:hypothetical protein
MVGLVFSPIVFRSRGLRESISEQINLIDVLLDKERASTERRSFVWNALLTKCMNAFSPTFSQPPKTNLVEEAKKELNINNKVE